MEAGLIYVEVEYEGLPGQCFYCKKTGHIAKECPRKMNSKVRVEKDKGQVVRQETTWVEGHNTIKGDEKEKAKANAQTLVLGCKNRLQQQEGNTTIPHVRLGNCFEELQEEEGLQQYQRTINVEEVVVCIPDVKLNNAKVSRENDMCSPSPLGKV